LVFFSLLIGDGGRELRLVIRHCAVDLSARTEGAVKSDNWLTGLPRAFGR